MGLVVARLGDYNKAIKLYENALIFCRQTGDAIGEANTLNNLGDAYLASANYQDTIATYGTAMQNHKSFGALRVRGVQLYIGVNLTLNRWLETASTRDFSYKKLYFLLAHEGKLCLCSRE